MSNPRERHPGVFVKVNAFAGAAERRRLERDRLRSVDACAAKVAGALVPDQPLEWESLRAIRLERDALRLRVAELEAELGEMIDRLTETERRKTKKVRGRPVTRKPLGSR